MPVEFMEWSLAGFLTLLELTIIFLIWKGAKSSANPQSGTTWRGINLEKVISEQDGSASFSRFQFLIFTFVIASAYIVYAFNSVSAGKGLPTIDSSVLGLIGMSGGSYLVSKGIENSASSEESSKSQSKPQNWPN